MQIPRNGFETSFAQGYILGVGKVSYHEFHM